MISTHTEYQRPLLSYLPTIILLRSLFKNCIRNSLRRIQQHTRAKSRANTNQRRASASLDLVELLKQKFMQNQELGFQRIKKKVPIKLIAHKLDVLEQILQKKKPLRDLFLTLLVRTDRSFILHAVNRILLYRPISQSIAICRLKNLLRDGQVDNKRYHLLRKYFLKIQNCRIVSISKFFERMTSLPDRDNPNIKKVSLILKLDNKRYSLKNAFRNSFLFWKTASLCRAIQQRCKHSYSLFQNCSKPLISTIQLLRHAIPSVLFLQQDSVKSSFSQNLSLQHSNFLRKKSQQSVSITSFQCSPQFPLQTNNSLKLKRVKSTSCKSVYSIPGNNYKKRKSKAQSLLLLVFRLFRRFAMTAFSQIQSFNQLRSNIHNIYLGKKKQRVGLLNMAKSQASRQRYRRNKLLTEMNIWDEVDRPRWISEREIFLNITLTN